MNEPVRYEDVTRVDLHRYAVDASDLAIAPGRWPTRIQTTLGNGEPLLLLTHDETGAEYRQSFGIVVVKVLNT